MKAQRNFAEANAILMQRHAAVIQNQLNSKTHSRGERRFNTTSRILMTAEAQAEWKVVKAALEAKETKKREDERKKKNATRDREAQHATTSTTFSRGLKTKSKEDLGDITRALGLSVEGTNKIVVEHIQAYLDANPSLADNPHFTGLFVHRK